MTEPDPNVPPEPQEPQAQPQYEPQAPDIDTAYRLVSEELGFDPRAARFEFEDIKRQRAAIAREKADLERQAQEARRYEPQPQFQDEGTAFLYRMFQEDREERRRERQERDREREAAEQMRRLSMDLDRAYLSHMRQNGVPPDQIESQRSEFFDGALSTLYPDGIPASIGVEGAIRNAYRFMRGQNGNGASYSPPRHDPRDRRQSIFIPGSAPSTTPQPADDSDVRRRPGETLEDHVLRLRAIAARQGVGTSIPEGKKLVFE